MKEVLIIIRPDMYFKTKNALTENRFFSMSTKEVFGRGKKSVSFSVTEGVTENDSIYNDILVAKKMISMVVPDEIVNKLVDVVISVNRNNTEGDGKIFIMPVHDSIRIHTGEIDEDALI